jgi:aspartate aminotransferase-like enzyme
MVHEWVRRNGFEFFAAQGNRSKSLTCVANSRDIDVPVLLKNLKERHGILLDGGYGKLKGKTFRISNMGDETRETIAELIAALDDSLPR